MLNRDLFLIFGTLSTHKLPMTVVWQKKLKLLYLVGLALILHLFVVEHIPAFGTNLIGVVSSRMLQSHVIPKQMSLKFVDRAFPGTAKQVIVELITTVDKYHLLVG